MNENFKVAKAKQEISEMERSKVQKNVEEAEGFIQWIGKEAEAFDEILGDRGDFCAFAGARGVATILEKAGCEHVKAVVQLEYIFSSGDTKNPSAEASLLGGRFYSDIWMKGGREIADEVIKNSEKESHDALEEAKRAEEAAKRAMIIGTFKVFASLFVSSFEIHHHILYCSRPFTITGAVQPRS